MCVCVRDTYTYPGVFEGVGGGHPLDRVDGQHLVDQVLGLWGHRVPLRRRKLWRGEGQGPASLWGFILSSIPSTLPLPASLCVCVCVWGGTHVVGPSLDLLIQPVLVLVPEGGVAHQEDVEDHPWREGTHTHTHTHTNQELHPLLFNLRSATMIATVHSTAVLTNISTVDAGS